VARHIDEEDIVQSVFRTFFQAANQGKYEVPAGEDLWNLLLVITLNKIRTQGAFYRAARRDARVTVPLEHVAAPGGGELGGGATTSPVLEVVLQDVLEQLPASHREIVDLRLEGHEVAAIAERTRRSKRTVERILQEVRAHLRTLLE
jgi:RNA polymerase sigma-70 factor (ECF subfamily)